MLFGYDDRPDFDVASCFLRAAILAGEKLTVLVRGDDVTVDDAPPGWDSAVLLAHSKMVGTLIE